MSKQIIAGVVHRPSGAPAADVVVEVFDRILSDRQDLLGRASTDEAGRFEVAYDPAPFWRSGRRGPALVVRATSEGGPSTVIDVGGADATALALTLDEAGDPAERLVKRIEAIVGTATFLRVPASELAHLALVLESSPPELTALRRALRLAQDGGLDLRLALRLTQSGGLDHARATPRRAVEAALGKYGDVAGALSALGAAWTAPSEEQPEPLRLAALALSPADFGRYLGAYLDHGAAVDPEQAGLTDAASARVRAVGALHVVTDASWPLTQALAREVGDGDITALDREAIARALATTPSALDARTIERRVEAIHPTRVVARRISDGRGWSGGQPALADFFSRATVADLARLDVPAALAALDPPIADPQTPALLQRVKLAFTTAPSFAVMDHLLSEGLEHPLAIVRSAATATDFARAHGGALGAVEAAELHRGASATIAALGGLIGAMSAERTAPVVPVLPPATTAAAPVPSWQSLFGDDAGCACASCASILSTSAYLADLLQFVRANPGAVDPLAALRERRPELFGLRLSCSNAEQTLPEIDLVNEVLERAILRQRPAAVVPEITETGGGARDRRAHPESLVVGVYDQELRDARYPFGLPFDLWTEEARAYLPMLGRTRLELMEATAGARDAAVTDPAIAAEHLGLGPRDVDVLLDHATLGDWGTANVSEMNRLDRLLESTGLGVTDALELLSARFVAGRDRGVDVTGVETCRVAEVTTDLYSAQRPFPLRRLHDFIRLRAALGWNTERLDRTLVALGAPSAPDFDSQPITPRLLVALSQVRRVADALGLPPDAVAGWLAPELDTHAYEIRGGTGVMQERIHELRIGATPGALTAPAVTFADPAAFTVLIELRLHTAPAALTTIAEQAGPGAVDWRIAVDATSHLQVTAADVTVTGPFLAAGDRTTMAVVFAGGEPPGDRLRLYLHGRRVPLPAVAIPAQTPNASTACTIPSGVDGAIRYLAILDRALADAEILALQRRPSLPPLEEQPALALWLTMGARAPASSPVVPDDSGHGRHGLLTGLGAADLLATLGATPRRLPTPVELRTLDAVPPYYRVFLDRAALARLGDGSYPLDPLSFAPQPRTLADEIAPIRAALALAEPELTELVAAQGWGRLDTAPLTLARLSRLHAHVELRRALGMAWPDYLALTADREPFASPRALLAFVDGARALSGRPHPLPDALELFGGRRRRGAPLPEEEAEIGDVVQRLADAVARADDPEVALLDQVLEQLGGSRRRAKTLLDRLLQPGEEAVATTVGEVLLAPTDARARRAWARVVRTQRLLAPYALDDDDVDHVFAGPEGAALAALPLAPRARLPWGLIERLARLARLRALLPASGRSASSHLAVAGDADAAAYWDRIAAWTGWPRDGLEAVAAGFAFPADFTAETGLLAVAERVSTAQAIAVAPQRVLEWGAPQATTAERAAAIKATARERWNDDAWWTKAAELRDGLRRKQRDALIAHLLRHRPAGAAQRPWRTVEDLSNYFLFDALVEPPVQTSRTTHAIAAIQTWVARALRGWEGPDALPPSAADAWAWRKNYRVWEANRNIFIYPENWLDPELRRSKTHLFERLERRLRRGEVDHDAALAALDEYLTGLEELSSLEIVGLIHDVDGRPLPSKPEVSHVLARTRGKRRAYYLREKSGADWGHWVPVGVEIGGDAVVGVKVEGHVLLLWAELTEGQRETTAHAYEDFWLLRASFTEYDGKSWSAPVTAADAAALPPELKDPPRMRLSVETARRRAQAVTADTLSLVVQYDDDQAIVASSAVVDLTLADRQFRAPPGAMAGTWFIHQPRSGPHGVTIRGQVAHERTDQAERPFQLDAFPPDVQRATTIELFAATPGPFRAATVGRYTMGISNAAHDMVYQDEVATFYLSNERPGDHRLALISHPQVARVHQIVRAQGLAAGLSLDVQRQVPDGRTPFRMSDYGPSPVIQGLLPDDRLDYRLGSPQGEYNWELFFHVPLLIADALRRNRQFTEALAWMHLIFDPQTRGPEDAPRRYWRFRPLNERTFDGQADDMLAALSYQGTNNVALGRRAEVEAQLRAWLESPFDPHAIARLRWSAYQRSTFMRYLDVLLEQADDLYRRGTRESVKEAVLVYRYAHELLGPRADSLPRAPAQLRPSYDELANAGLDALSNAIADALPPGGLPGVRAHSPREEALVILDLLAARSAFCAPANPRLDEYRRRLDDRLYNVRRSLDIDGAFRDLPLTDPPIDPGVLARASAQGLSIDAVMRSVAQVRFRHYRFTALIAKAIELAEVTRGFGQALLAAVEREDGDALARLRSEQELELFRMGRQLKSLRLKELQASHQSVRVALAQAEARVEYFATRMPLSAGEVAELEHLESARGAEEMSSVMQVVASALSMLPNLSLPLGIGTPSVSFGGSNLGAGFSAVAEGFRSSAAADRHVAMMVARTAAYRRRAEEWTFQAAQARADVQRYQREAVASEIRVAMAGADIDAHDRDVAQRLERDRVMKAQFSRSELYAWMIGQLSEAHAATFDLAMEVAGAAQAAYAFETRDDTTFLQPTYWDSFKKGLLAGDQLLAALRRMEVEFMDRRVREHEATKHVSLLLVAPVALDLLRRTGSAPVALTEALFDEDYPGQYMRRIDGVSISIPTVIGPYTTVNCTLTLEESWTRESDSTTGAPTGDAWAAAPESIITTTAREDGMIGDARDDGRRRPFQGRGAISRWRVDLPQADNKFPLSAVSDVILHVRYTARSSSARVDAARISRFAALPGAPAADLSPAAPRPADGEPGRRFISLRADFPDAWASFLATGAGVAELRLRLDRRGFPARVRAGQLRLRGLALGFVLSPTAAGALVPITVTAPGLSADPVTPVRDPIAPVATVALDAPNGGEIDGEDLVVRVPASALAGPLASTDLVIICQFTVGGPGA